MSISLESKKSSNENYINNLTNNPLRGIPSNLNNVPKVPKILNDNPNKNLEKVKTNPPNAPILSRRKISTNNNNNNNTKLIKAVKSTDLNLKKKYNIDEFKDRVNNYHMYSIFGKIKEKNENIFKKETIECTMKVLTKDRFLLDNRGYIKDVNMITKKQLWDYIVYIRNRNKDLDEFKHLLKGNVIINHKLYLVIIEYLKKKYKNIKIKEYKITKNDLYSFITMLLDKEDLKLPFLRNYIKLIDDRKNLIEHKKISKNIKNENLKREKINSSSNIKQKLLKNNSKQEKLKKLNIEVDKQLKENQKNVEKQLRKLQEDKKNILEQKSKNEKIILNVKNNISKNIQQTQKKQELSKMEEFNNRKKLLEIKKKELFNNEQRLLNEQKNLNDKIKNLENKKNLNSKVRVEFITNSGLKETLNPKPNISVKVNNK